MKAHWIDNEAPISIAEVVDSGVYYAEHSTVKDHYRGPIDLFMEERGYISEDEVVLGPDTPNLEAICAKFVDEHHHDDDEVRFVIEGEGIFDIRSPGDRWMRVVVEVGDLIVVPAGRHHRFMLTDAKAIRCIRLFKDEAGWEPHYRSS